MNADNGVLDNDTDVDGDALTSQLLLPPSSGQLALNTDGSFSYTPDPGFVGTDRFIYKVDDGKGGTDVALATINVNQNQLTIQATSGDGTSEILLRRNGDQLEIVIGNDTGTVALDQFGLIVIHGVDGEPDLLTIDFAAGGFFTIPSGIEVSGGAGDGDTLTVIGVAGTSAVLTPGAIGDGLLTIERNGESIDVRYDDVESAGVSSIDDFTINGNLNVGDRTVTFVTRGFTKLGPRTTIDGGTLIAGGLALGPGDVLIGNGTVDSRIAADVGSTIDADGDLTLGDVNAFDGFFSDGVLQTNDHTVTILDRDLGVLGALTEVGNANGPGVLASQNGLLLENGKTLSGYGVINGNFENQGHVVGEGPNSSHELVFTGNVSGRGKYDGNVRFTGAFGAGEGPAEAEFGGDATFDASSTVQIDIGGLAAGEFDRLTIAGDLRLGGALQVSLVDLGNGYEPKLGDRFAVMTFGSAEGEFIDVTGTRINERFRLDPVFEQGRLDLVVVHATWHNFDTSHDVNVDGFVTPNDVLRIINELNRSSPRSLPLPTVRLSPPPFYDVNRDQFLSPNDVLQVINFLNQQISGESEGGVGDFVEIAQVSPIDSLPGFPVDRNDSFAFLAGASHYGTDGTSMRHALGSGRDAANHFSNRDWPGPVAASRAVLPRVARVGDESFAPSKGGRTGSLQTMQETGLDSEQSTLLEDILSELSEDVRASRAARSLHDLALENLGS